MIKIGIVGDIGAGKSFIARQFGYPVFDADKQVSKIYKENNNCFKNLKKIENIVHPEVQKYMKKFIKINKNKKILIFDIPLLIENKIYNKKKMVLVFVDAKKKDINKKLRKRKNYDEKIIKKLRKFQLPLEIKKKKSNYLIKNDFKSLNLRKHVKILKNKILNANE